MFIARRKEGGYEVIPFAEAFPQVSVCAEGPNAEFMQEHELLPVSSHRIFNPDTEELQQVEPYEENGMVYTVRVMPICAGTLKKQRETKIHQVHRHAELFVYETMTVVVGGERFPTHAKALATALLGQSGNCAVPMWRNDGLMHWLEPSACHQYLQSYHKQSTKIAEVVAMHTRAIEKSKTPATYDHTAGWPAELEERNDDPQTNA